jgi:hypothetical protein
MTGSGAFLEGGFHRVAVACIRSSDRKRRKRDALALNLSGGGPWLVGLRAVPRPGTGYNVTGSIEHRATISSSPQARSLTAERPKNALYG